MKAQGVNGDNAIKKLTLIHNHHYSPAGNALYGRALVSLLAELTNARNTFTSSGPAEGRLDPTSQVE